MSLAFIGFFDRLIREEEWVGLGRGWVGVGGIGAVAIALSWCNPGYLVRSAWVQWGGNWPDHKKYVNFIQAGLNAHPLFSYDFVVCIYIYINETYNLSYNTYKGTRI